MNNTSFRRLIRAFAVGMQTGLLEMRKHKLRSFLSLLGVMLGVGALVAMLTIVGGVDDFMQREMGDFAGRIGISGGHQTEDPKEQLIWSRSPGFRFSDLDFMETLREVSKVYKAINQRDQIVVGDEALGSRITGVNADYFDIETNVVLKEGRYFQLDEYEKGLPVCVVSSEIMEKLRKKKNAGSFIHIFGKRFRVVGSFELKNKQFRRRHFMNLVYIPLLTMKMYGSGFNPDPGWATLRVSNVKDIQNQIVLIGENLAREHRGVEDFEFHLFEFLDEFIKMLNNVKILFGTIAVCSLLVGGLGIMNVMLSSLSERIHEIGIRQALGASPAQVFVQVLAETVLLSSVGGMFGAAIGSLPMWFSEQIYKAGGELIRPQLQSEHIVLVLWIVVGIGILFGLYPAIKASRLNPVEALHYE